MAKSRSWQMVSAGKRGRFGELKRCAGFPHCTFASYSPTLSSMGEMRRGNAREQEERMRDRFSSTLVIAVAIIAAVRLAREDITRPSPRLLSAVADSVSPARMILMRVVGRSGY